MARKLYYLAEISGGRLYLETGKSHTTLAKALAAEVARGWRPNHLIVAYSDVKKYGTVVGTHADYFSAMDGVSIPARNIEVTLR